MVNRNYQLPFANMDDSNFTLSESRIAIIGLGLMGGSLALGLRGKCAAIYGIDPHLPTLELALSQHIVDFADSDPAKLLPEVDLVILSAPVPAILTLLEQLPTLTPNPCIIMDDDVPANLLVDLKPGPTKGVTSSGVVSASADEIKNGKWLVDARMRSCSTALSILPFAPRASMI